LKEYLFEIYYPCSEYNSFQMYHFEPGSYKTPNGFLAAIACYKDESTSCEYILVKSNLVLITEESAVKKSEDYLNKAFSKREQTGNDRTVARSLKLDGFKKIDNPRIAE
jgi:hypothetical protein